MVLIKTVAKIPVKAVVVKQTNDLYARSVWNDIFRQVLQCVGVVVGGGG